MTSPAPLRYETYYHIYNRGNNRENIFVEKRNYVHFLKLYEHYIEPVAETFAYCLLRNHFHVLVYIKSEVVIGEIKTPSSKGPLNPSNQFSKLFNAYAKAINSAYERTGSLFQHPFGRVEVTTNAHFTRLVPYIHQNPQRHGLVSDFREWVFSSYHAHISNQKSHLKREDVLNWFGGAENYMDAHKFVENEGLIARLAPDDFD